MSNKKVVRQHRINDCILVVFGILGTWFSFSCMKAVPNIALIESVFLGFLFYGGFVSIFLGLYFAIKDFSLKY